MNNKAALAGFAAAGVFLASLFSFAHDENGEFNHYVTDGSGNFATSGDGGCVYSGGDENYKQFGCFPTPTPEPTPVPTPVPTPEPTPVPTPIPTPVPTPVPTPEPPKPAAPPIAVTQSFNLAGGALFGNNSSELTSAGKAQLIDFSTKLKSTEGLNVSKIRVLGHTDSRGSSSYNQQLSERRAQAVANYLKSIGLDGSTIEVVGAGETQPIADNDTAEGRAKNRRVELQVSGTQTSYK